MGIVRARGHAVRTTACVTALFGLLTSLAVTTAPAASARDATITSPRMALAAPLVGMAATPSGAGYWQVARDGGIFSFGNAAFYGSTGATRLNKPMLGMERTKSGNGYWLFAQDGGIFAFGDAQFFGSLGGQALSAPIVSMQRTATGNGYWMLGGDGKVYAFGDA